MADIRRGIQSMLRLGKFADAGDFVFPGIPLCIKKPTSKFMSSISSLWNKYLQSNKHIAEQNSKRERQDALSDKEESMEANFLWERRRYVLLLATVAASITYSAVLSPPGGFGSHNRGGHFAGDLVLQQVTHPSRCMAFFYINATAFVVYLAVQVIHVIVHSLSRRALQAAMLLADKFGLKGACYAVGNSKSNLRARDGGQSVEPETLETLERARNYVLIFATLVTMMTYQAGLSMPGKFLSDGQDHEHISGDPMPRRPHPSLYVAFFYCNSTAFMASVAVVMLLLSRPMRRHGFWSCALWVCIGAVLMGLTGAFAFGSSIIFRTSIYVTSLMAAVLLNTVLPGLFSLRKPVENWLGNVQETQQKYQKLDQLFLSQDHRGETSSYDPQGNLDADQLLKRHRKYLLLLGILATSVTYQAGLNPPGGFWQSNASDDGPDHLSAGDPIIQVTYPRRYLAFFYFSLVILILVLSSSLGTQGIKYYVLLQVTMILDLFGLIGSYSAGSCRSETAAAEDDPDRTTTKRNSREATWHVACAAAHHMTGDLRLLLAGSYSPVHDDDGNGDEDVLVHQSSGEPPLRVRGSGSVRTESIALDDVWYVPGLGTNLVSTGQLARLGCAITLGPGGCRITRGDALVGSARFTDGYQFELDFLKVAVASSK